MTRSKSLLTTLLGTAIVLSVASSQALAKEKSVTLIQLSDVHGHIHPHAEIFPDGRMDPHSGGLAKLTTLINEVRDDNPDSLLLAVGDSTHGGAEMLFSLGDLIMPWMNDIGIDAFTPGNWDFGWGPRVYRQRFTNASPPLAPNNRTTIAWMDNMSLPGHPDYRKDQECNTPPMMGNPFIPYAKCHVIRATFPTVAMNLYNYDEVGGINDTAQELGPLVHKAYITKDVDQVKVAIMGLTSDVVPQQAQAFNTGFRFTMGYKEMPEQIAAAKAEGAELIVVLSELGLAKNVQMVKEFPEIDVMFSGHTHERTPEAIVIEHADNTISLVTEAGEDSFIGRLDLKLTGNGKINKYEWTLMEADHKVAEDDNVADMVAAAQSTFLSGQCHTFGVNAFPFGTGHTLCDPLDHPIGKTEVTIQRWNVLEDISNNVMVDAFADLAKNLGEMDSKGNYLTDANTLSTTNGFRFDVVIFGEGEELDDGSKANGDITIGDLYDYYPIGAATGLAEYTGGRLKLHWEGILNNVFDPNPYRQRGGWFLGFTNNMHFDIRLSDDFPRSISYGKRIANVTIDDGTGAKRIDDSKIYTLASCYPHGNPTDEVCRTAGATNLRFITAKQETSGSTDIFGNRQLNMSGPFTVLDPVVTDAQLPVFDPSRTPIFRKVAPDNFVHPVDALRRYLSPSMVGHIVNVADDGLGRVTAVDPVPVSEFGGPGIVQPTQGAGAEWLKREFID
jgi:2',3'-cyclic-nucleotide 2'-phosphodiesterase (5'-nucleotidase family)